MFKCMQYCNISAKSPRSCGKGLIVSVRLQRVSDFDYKEAPVFLLYVQYKVQSDLALTVSDYFQPNPRLFAAEIVALSMAIN